MRKSAQSHKVVCHLELTELFFWLGFVTFCHISRKCVVISHYPRWQGSSQTWGRHEGTSWARLNRRRVLNLQAVRLSKHPFFSPFHFILSSFYPHRRAELERRRQTGGQQSRAHSFSFLWDVVGRWWTCSYQALIYRLGEVSILKWSFLPWIF